MCKGEKKTRGRPENGRKPQAIAWRKAKGRKRERNWLFRKAKRGEIVRVRERERTEIKKLIAPKNGEKKNFVVFFPLIRSFCFSYARIRTVQLRESTNAVDRAFSRKTHETLHFDKENRRSDYCRETIIHPVKARMIAF